MRGIWVLLLFGFCKIQAQVTKTEEKEELKHHRVAVVISHTHVPKAFQSSVGYDAVIVPSWGFNYEYWFNYRWALGLHNDMEIATYLIEGENGQSLERKRPLIVSVVAIYKPWKGLELVMGVGMEFEENHNFRVYRFGVEYEIAIGHHWDIAPSLVFDIKEDLYDSWTLGLGVGRKF